MRKADELTSSTGKGDAAKGPNRPKGEGAHVTSLRSCIGCGSQAKKGVLLRVVKAPDGHVDFDRTGRAAGRGAYVCSAPCFEKASRSGKLDRALRIKLSEDDRVRIGCALRAAVDETSE